jgi:hypothetical protein
LLLFGTLEQLFGTWNLLAALPAKPEFAVVGDSPALFVQRDEFLVWSGRVPIT